MSSRSDSERVDYNELSDVKREIFGLAKNLFLGNEFDIIVRNTNVKGNFQAWLVSHDRRTSHGQIDLLVAGDGKPEYEFAIMDLEKRLRRDITNKLNGMVEGHVLQLS